MRRPVDPTGRLGGPAGALFLLTVGVIFAVSGGLLWDLGVNYDGITGSAAGKLHPATYLGFVLFGLVAVSRPNPAAFLGVLLARHPRTCILIGLTCLQIAVILADGRPNLATAFDTFLLPALLLIAISELHPRWVRRAEILVHVLMGLNALMALAEFMADYRVFPFRFEGEPFVNDTRSSALHGHPLINATVTGCYVLGLAAGGGAALRGGGRAAMIVVQLAALVTFGGRSAGVLVLLILAGRGAREAHRILTGGRIPVGTAAIVSLSIAGAVLAGAALSAAGFFDAFLGRFEADGGSAETRIEMFDLLASLPVRDLIAGPRADLVDSLRWSEGLEWGIENPLVRMVLYQGVIVTVLMLAGFVLFLTELSARLRPGAWTMFLFFLVVVNSFESLASKSTLLAKFVILCVTLFRREAGAAYRARRPRASTIAGSGTRPRSSPNSPKPSNRFQNAHGKP